LEQQARSTERGAVVTFQGVVRQDQTAAGPLDHLVFAADEPKAQKVVAGIVEQISKKYPGTNAAVQQRLGRVNIGETSLFIAVSSPKKANAFNACRFAMDRMRSAVPLWKDVVCADGTSQRSASSHETMLLADEAITIPES